MQLISHRALGIKRIELYHLYGVYELDGEKAAYSMCEKPDMVLPRHFHLLDKMYPTCRKCQESLHENRWKQFNYKSDIRS